MQNDRVTPVKTNITLENQAFEDVSPTRKLGDFPFGQMLVFRVLGINPFFLM